MDIQYDIDSFKPTEIKILKAYVISSSIKTIQKVDFNKYLNFKGQDILLVDSTSIYQIDRLKNPIVVLQHSPKINLKRLFHILKPSIVVADGSNYKSYVNSWRASSKKKGIPFYYTGQQGAFVLSE
jgi:competence protein ComEC